MSTKIKKLTEDDGHWYWIPENEVEQFNADSEKLEGKEYMDCPDEFDSFIYKYDHYRTGGAPELVPDCFDGNKIEFIN